MTPGSTEDDVEAPESSTVAAEPGVSRRSGILDRHRGLVIAVGSTYLALATVAPIATTPYRSDDKINHLLPEQITGTGLAWFGSAMNTVGMLLDPWIRDWGRFFPGSSTWTVFIFSVLQNRLSYKIFLAALALTMIVLTAALVGTLVRAAVAPVVVVGLAGSLTLRNWFDGLDTFSGVLPLTICLVLASLLLLLRRDGRLSAMTAGFCWLYALLTYEVAILLTPTLVYTVWSVRRRWRRTLPIIVPVIAVGVVVSILRARALRPPGNAYRMNLALGDALPTYLRQVMSGLPLAEQWYPGSAPLVVDRGLIVLALLLIAVPAAAILTAVARGQDVASWPRPGRAALIGASCWLLPPLLIGVSVGWQNELPPGEGYVSVVWCYIGVAILMAAGWMVLARRAMSRPSVGRTVILHAATAAMATICALTFAQSVTIATIAQTISM